MFYIAITRAKKNLILNKLWKLKLNNLFLYLILYFILSLSYILQCNLFFFIVFAFEIHVLNRIYYIFITFLLVLFLNLILYLSLFSALLICLYYQAVRDNLKSIIQIFTNAFYNQYSSSYIIVKYFFFYLINFFLSILYI